MDYVITMDDSKQYLSHHGILGMKWGRRKQKQTSGSSRRSGSNARSGPKRVLRKNMTAEQRHMSNKQIGLSIVGSMVGSSVGSAVGSTVGSLVGGSGWGQYIGTGVGSALGSIGGISVANAGKKVNKNQARTNVMAYLLGPFGASTIYDHR